jgi:uncharacterized protein (TIGR03000 family)
MYYRLPVLLAGAAALLLWTVSPAWSQDKNRPTTDPNRQNQEQPRTNETGRNLNQGDTMGRGYGYNTWSSYPYGYNSWNTYPNYGYNSWGSPYYGYSGWSRPYFNRFGYNWNNYGYSTYSYPSDYYSYYSEPPGGNYPAYGTGDSPMDQTIDTVQITVRVPQDAEVWFDGKKTQQGGMVRQYISPPLSPDKTYTYHMRVRFRQGDKEVDRTRDITVQAGDMKNVDFLRQGPSYGEMNREEGKREGTINKEENQNLRNRPDKSEGTSNEFNKEDNDNLKNRNKPQPPPEPADNQRKIPGDNTRPPEQKNFPPEK